MSETRTPYTWLDRVFRPRATTPTPPTRPTVHRLIAVPAEDLELLVDAARDLLARDSLAALEGRRRPMTEAAHKRLNAARLRAMARLSRGEQS